MAACRSIFLVSLVFGLLALSANALFLKNIAALPNNSSAYDKVLYDIDVFKNLDPNLEFVELNLLSDDVKQQIVYTLGARMPGDYIVARGAKNQSWPTPQNVGITINYPTSGIGAQVTYIYIAVNQSTPSGRAYITKGGIHQRFITMVVEAYNTMLMNIEINIFGIA